MCDELVLLVFVLLVGVVFDGWVGSNSCGIMG